MTDLIERLRNAGADYIGACYPDGSPDQAKLLDVGYEHGGLHHVAADEIERLRQRVEFLMGIVDVRENETARLRGLLTSIRSRLSPGYAPWAKWIARIDAEIGKEEPR